MSRDWLPTTHFIHLRNRLIELLHEFAISLNLNGEYQEVWPLTWYEIWKFQTGNFKIFDILTGSGTLRFGFGTSRSPKYQVQIKLNLVKMVNFPRTITFFSNDGFHQYSNFSKISSNFWIRNYVKIINPHMTYVSGKAIVKIYKSET